MRKFRGFTVNELAICVVVIAILSAAGWLGLQNYYKSLKIAEAEANINTLGTAHIAYYYNKGAFATNAELVNGGYISATKMWNGTQMLDPWNNAIVSSTSGSVMTLQLSAASQAKAGRNITFTVQ